jgi:outer membrane protein OmpA-like peptidoglycan-associated protein
MARSQPVFDTIILYFPFNQHSLTPSSRALLDTFITWNQDIPYDKVLITGYCDAKGSNAYNDPLSVERARMVRSYLLQRGLPSSQVTILKGYGKRKPENANRTPEEQQLNRKVELVGVSDQSAVSQVTVKQYQLKDTVSFNRKSIENAREGQNLILQEINFYGGRHTFLPTSQPILNELLTVMRQNPKLEIEIEGHICCRKSREDAYDLDEENQHLSLNRARAVYDFLVEGGIDPARMGYRGFGGQFPQVYPEITDEDRRRNRRVEIKIIKK